MNLLHLRLALAQQAWPKLARMVLVLALVLAQLVAPPKPPAWVLQGLELEWQDPAQLQRKELPIPASSVPMAGQEPTEPLAGKCGAQQTTS